MSKKKNNKGQKIAKDDLKELSNDKPIYDSFIEKADITEKSEDTPIISLDCYDDETQEDNTSQPKKPKSKYKWLLYLLLLLILVSLITIYLINNYGYRVKFKLLGDKEITLTYPDLYEEPGYTVTACVFNKCQDISALVGISGTVNTEKLGTYEIKYNLSYKNKKYTKTRTINIIEKEPPQIELAGDKEIILCPNTQYTESGYTATDNYDGDITDKVKVTTKDNTIYYEVEDSSGNITTETRTITYTDNTSPVISLKGASDMSLTIGTSYQESGYTATDNCDGNITDKITVLGNVNTDEVGTYTLTYNVKDSAGNTSSVNRRISIYDFTTNNINTYISSLESYIKNNNYNVAIGYVNLNTGCTYTYRENFVFYGASLVKTVDALYAYENLELTDEVKELVSKAISVSDNNAHQTLVRTIGKDNLRSYGHSLGATQFLVEPTDNYGNTTVKDQIAIWKYLYNFINTNPNGNELKSYFINTYANNLIFYGSPTIMHKYGLHKQYYHDVGIVYDNSPYIVVILTNEGYDNFSGIVSDLSEKIYKLNKLS